MDATRKAGERAINNMFGEEFFHNWYVTHTLVTTEYHVRVEILKQQFGWVLTKVVGGLLK